MTADRWFQFSLAEQMGNIGSEISRADYFEKMEDHLERNKALERALEMIDFTISDKRYSGRLKEICHLREIVSDLLLGASVYQVTLGDLLDYLMPFAILARK